MIVRLKAGEKMFTHLQLQTGYNFFNRTITIKKLINRAKHLNMEALALTDEGVLYGAIEFYQACRNEGIHPIIGMTMPLYLHPGVDKKIPVVLLAKNNIGYQHLMQISTIYQTEGDCDIEKITSFAQNLICIIPSEPNAIEEKIISHGHEVLKEWLPPLLNAFHKEDIFLGVANRTVRDESVIEAAIVFTNEIGIEAVAMQDVRYLEEKDVISYDCLQAMKSGEKWQGYTNRPGFQQRHFASVREMENKFSAWPSLIKNISLITALCNVKLDFNRQLMPAFPVPQNKTASSYLQELTETALTDKYTNNAQEASERLQYELEVIQQLEFSDYFLIVSDFVQFAKNNGIATGPGRGSAAGSIVAYLLGITNVDPLKYGLLFERFLNPERVTMHDIDIDFSDVRRSEVIAYVRDKYGSSHVAQIITFGTFLARSILRELMKTMDIDYRDQAYILKHLSQQKNENIIEMIERSDSFREYIKQSEQLKLLFQVALKLEGLPRHMSTHAAGIVIGKQSLMEDVPLIPGPQDTYLTQYAMNDLESIGLLKIDMLGLRNLSLMERIVKTVEKREHIKLEPEQFPINDAATFKLLQSGLTNGIFQLESNGMKRVLKNLKPDTLEDIVAVNALYRPGPMKQIQVYIDRKQGREAVTYPHSDLEPILSPTYGVLVYQEQIMQVAHQFAGLSLGEADILRRAISEKNHQLINEQKERFLEGCKNKGYSISIGEEIFSWIEKFADYGFNKSHSVAYSKIGYQLSYLKTHYTAAFFANFLKNMVNDNHFSTYIKEANQMGIDVLRPDINRSFAYFTVENESQIRLGFLAVKGIGYETAKQIVDKRASGRFSDVFDFCLRVDIKRSSLETLILAGFFDSTYDNRASVLASLDQAYARAELFGDLHEGDLFKDELKMAPAYTNIEDFSLMQRLRDEKELLQMYISNHPIQAYRQKLSLLGYTTLAKVKKLPKYSKSKLIVILERVKKIHTKRGESMAFITVSDESGEIEAVVFPALYREVNPILNESQIIYVEGKVSYHDNAIQITVDNISSADLEVITNNVPSFIYIKVTKEKHQKEVLSFLKNVANDNPRETMIILFNESEKKTFKLTDDYHVKYSEAVLKELKSYFGNKNVVFSK